MEVTWLWPLCLVALSSFGAWLVLTWSHRDARDVARKQESLSYQSDVFFGLVWKWTYGARECIQDPGAYCPRCNDRILVVDISEFDDVPRIRFVCENCRAPLLDFDGPFEFVQSDVTRLIRKKIRSRSFAQLPSASGFLARRP